MHFMLGADGFAGFNDETPSLFTSIQAMKKGAFDEFHLPVDMKK
jgi:hypothetical protein